MTKIAATVEEIKVHTFYHNQCLPISVGHVSSGLVGRGASATVYKGVMRLPHHSEEVALKVFNQPFGEDKNQLLRRELTVVLRACHRWIMPFIGTSSLNDHTVLVSRYMKNGNLLQYLLANPTVSRRRLVLQVAEAVHFLHACARIVHGDLKCENVLVSDSGDALLTDFGLSTAVHDEVLASPRLPAGYPTTLVSVPDRIPMSCTEPGSDTAQTMTLSSNRQQFTLRFAAPEILYGPELLEDAESPADDRGRTPGKTEKTDVYAFGMLMVQAFTGKQPWPQLQDNQIPVYVYARTIHPRPDESSGLDDHWWDVCVRCIAFAARNRPDMFDVWTDLAADPTAERGSSTRPLLFETDRTVAGAESGFLPYIPPAPRTPPRLHHASREVGFYGHTGSITCVRYLSCGARIVTCSRDSTLRIWDGASGSCASMILRGHVSDVLCIAASPNGSQIASGGVDCTLIRWNVLSGASLGPPMFGHTGRVMSVAYSPDATRIVSASFDRTLRCWDSLTGAALGRPLYGHANPIWCVEFSIDGGFIASGSWDECICLWDSTTGECLARLTNESGVRYSTFSLCFSSDGQRLVSGSRDSAIRIWDFRKRQLEHKIRVHPSSINAVAISPTGNYIASAGSDGCLCLWETETGMPLGSPFRGHTEAIKSIEISRNGHTLLSGSDDRVAYMWKLAI